MKTRRHLLKSALGLATVVGAAASAQAATSIASTRIQPIGVTNIVGLLPSTPVPRGSIIRFYVQVTINGQPAPAGLYVAIQERIGSALAAPRTIALCPTTTCGWIYYDYCIPTDKTKTSIFLSAYYGGRSGTCPLTAHESNKTLVPIASYGRIPV